MKEIMKASIVKAIDERYFADAHKFEDQLERMSKNEQRIRRAKKGRSKVIVRCRADMNARARSADPKSDNESVTPVATQFFLHHFL